MNGKPRDLGTVQRWMQAVIMHPEGIESGIGSEAAKSEIDVSADEAEQVVTRSRALTAIERLQVYGNAYFARLIEVLRDEFPAFRRAVGEETFDAFALGYIHAYPSHSYTLSDLSANFPRFLEETRPESTPAAQSSRGAADTARLTSDTLTSEPPVWSDFLIDLARLERTYSEVFDGPGPERGRLLQPDDLKQVPPDRWPDVRLIPVECLRLLVFRFPVHEYASAVRRGEEAAIPQPAATYLAVSRREYIVRRQPLTKAQFELLQAVIEGNTLGESIQRAVENSEADVETLAGELHRWFRAWTAAQFFRGIASLSPR